VLQPLHTGNGKTAALGYIGHGGTLTVPGMLFVNQVTWAHIVAKTAHILGLPREEFLNSQELAALEGEASPEGIIV